MKRNKTISILSITLLIALVLPGLVCAADNLKININSAPVDELVKLEKIGPQYAKRIVEYRETAGPFNAPEDIMKVKGIGAKTYEANKDIIVVK